MGGIPVGQVPVNNGQFVQPGQGQFVQGGLQGGAQTLPTAPMAGTGGLSQQYAGLNGNAGFISQNESGGNPIQTQGTFGSMFQA